ncbi:MAG: InlB B-repeat-containing protein, partial [Firmicutes bacterium]|nr:InlB B-repeat-containing protein [Bacillota bacterium]
MPQEINDDEIQSPPNPSPPLESEGLEPLLGYAETRMFLGEMQEAKNAFLKAVRRYPEDWRAHFGMVKFHTNNFTDFTVPELRYSNYLRRARETVPEEESVKLETEYGHYCKKRQGEQTQAQSKEDALKNAGGMTGLKYEIEREEARKAAKVKKVSKRLGIVAAIVAGAAAVIITAVLVILYLTEDLRWQIGEDRANTYTVTYTYTDESGAEKTVTQKFDLRTGVLLGAPVREGYTLAWYTSPECTKEFRYRFTDKPEEIDRKASSEEGKISWLGKKALQLWTRWLGSYTVTFDSNGGSNIPPLLTDEEGVATKPQDPTRNGFVFGGWFLDEELTRPASVDNIFSDTVLYAKWVERCTVTFDTQGGNNVNAVTVDAGGRINQQPNATRGGGYTFAGWYLDPECTDDNFVSFPYTVQKSVTLYAKWVERVQYTITFETNGGTNVNDQNMVVRDPGTQVTLPTISKPGFRFLGWFTDAACNAESRVATNYTIQANATLYAGWEETAQVVVTFVTNGGSNANGNNINNNVRVMEPNQQIGTQPTSGRTGYNFLGWYTDEACTPESKVTFPYTVTASITLYAGWIAQVPVTVTFDPQGGTNANGTNINNNVRNMQAGQIITTEPTSTRPDYNLLGWYTMDECTPESKVNFPYTVLGNITLYAGWIEQVRFTITFETNGGNTIAPRTFEAGNINAGQMPGNPSRGAGFRFAGWYTDEYFDERSRVTFPFALTGENTLYAKWDEQYRLTLNALGVPMTGATTFDRYYDVPINANQLPAYNTSLYTLDGWYFDANYAEKAEFPLYIDQNTTLYAKWAGRHIVTFESNGGSAVSPVTVTEGTPMAWPLDPTRYGYLFAGWYTNIGLTTRAESSFAPTQNATLYAKWLEKEKADTSKMNTIAS